MAFEDYTVSQFERALFKDDFTETGIPKDILSVVYDEYIDVSGLYDVDEFLRILYIHFLLNRINCVKIGVVLHKKFLEEFKVPYKINFKILTQFGHRLRWNNDSEDFIRQLDKIEKSEKKYISQLEGKLKDLEEYREKKKKNKKEEDIPVEEKIKKSRPSFIKTINSLGKVGYRIDRFKTTVEDLSYMIQEEMEKSKDINTNSFNQFK